jgi:hypothetical protein
VMHDPPDYYGNNGGHHWGYWILMIAAMLAFWGILAWAVVTIIRHRGVDHASPQVSEGAGSDALRILDEGDIEAEE